jgi:uncharacterized membrane protein YfcA
MGFSPKHAIPLSNVTVLGGAVANTILNTRKRHPLADRPLVDWDLILVMEPLTIGGALIGAFLNKLLPEQFLVIMLVALLSFTAYTSLTKAIRMYKKETRAMRAQSRSSSFGVEKESELTRMVSQKEDEDDEEAGDSLVENMEVQEDETSPGDGDLHDVDLTDELQQILDEERVTPLLNIMILFTMFIVVLFINIMKGGGAFPSPVGIKCGSKSFWTANVVMLGWILVISFFARAYLVKRWETKQKVGYKYVEGDIEWNARATIVYPVVCCLAGFFAGMFGIGKYDQSQHLNGFGSTFCQPKSFLSFIYRRRHCQGPIDATNGRASSCLLGQLSLYDPLYKLHREYFLCCLWTSGLGLCLRVSHHWSCRDLCRSNRPRLPHATISTKLLHCFFDWRRRAS